MNTKQKKIELVKKWIAALRSGEYKQGRDALVQKTGKGLRYCCLGVLCDISKDEFNLKPDGNVFVDRFGGRFSISLPLDLSNYLSLREESEYNMAFEDVLVNLNDGSNRPVFEKKRKFSTIANYIEKNILPRLEE